MEKEKEEEKHLKRSFLKAIHKHKWVSFIHSHLLRLIKYLTFSGGDRTSKIKTRKEKYDKSNAHNAHCIFCTKMVSDNVS